MKISHSILSGLCVAGILSVGIQAQDSASPRKIPQLTMDDFENRTSVTAPGSSSMPVVSGGATNTGRNTNGAGLPPAGTDGRSILDSAWSKIGNLNSGRVKMAYRNAKGEGESYLYEFAGTDRTRIIKDGGEVIMIGSMTYTRIGREGWKQLPPKDSNKNDDLSFRNIAKSFTKISSQVQLVGEDVLNQLPMLKYKLSDKNQDVSYVWIGKGDGLVYKLEGTSASTGTSVQMIFSDHNAAISINPPAQ